MTYRLHLQPENRFHFATVPRSPRVSYRGRSLAFGWTIITLFSLLTLAWLAYRLVGQPGWLTQLPELVQELIGLLEAAAVFTLVSLWLVLLWRWGRGLLRPQRQWHLTRAPRLTVDQLYDLSPPEFEQYVGQLFRQKGYEVFVRGRSGDMGVDLEIKAPGNRRAIAQCKRYQTTVGAETVRELYGTLIHERALHAFLVTTADVSEAAREWARGKPITLIDGQTLVKIAAALEIS